MTVTDAVALAGSLGPGRTAERFSTCYGLAYRFTVEIAGVDIGTWQSCGGLKVEFKPAELKTGGHYTGLLYLPGEVSYSKVVLKRAVDPKQSKKLQQWLSDSVAKPTPQSSTAKICLYDSYGGVAMTWTLDRPRPSAWSGPDLDAGSSKVAVETLELVHEGFVVTAGTEPTTGAPESKAETFTLKEPKSGLWIGFTYPPNEIQVTKANPSSARNKDVNTNRTGTSRDGNRTRMTSRVGNLTAYAISNLLLEGPDVAGYVDRLTTWATPIPTMVEGKWKDTLRPLTLNWGKGFVDHKVVLATMSASFIRFDPDGMPSRAKVTLRLEEIAQHTPRTVSPPSPTPTSGAKNPTSGGIPGRRSHLVLASENLPTLARDCYGRHERWREIADANSVDDPLRLLPGTTLYLPAPSEIGAVGGDVS